MPEPLSATVTVSINGSRTIVQEGTMVSAALLTAGQSCRVSITGQPRTALCGMGICFECRAIVDGVPYTRTCQLVCKDGMQVETQR
jgi:D-hydroxyproline dehydrogenase subunit gamma